MGKLPGMSATSRKRGNGGSPSKGFGCSLVLICHSPGISAFLGAEYGRLAVKGVQNSVKTWGDILKMQKEVSCSFPATSIKILTLLCASL